MKKFIYLISPEKINENKFYKELNQVLKTKKIKFFQLRLKKITNNNLIKISKKVKKITKQNKVKFLINDKPLIAKEIELTDVTLVKKILVIKIVGKFWEIIKLLGLPVIIPKD